MGSQDSHVPGEAGPNQDSVIRGYKLGKEIGAGAFGAVYRAFQTSVHREVAIKIIHPEFANDPAFVRRFESEAQIVAKLEHPHIVPLYDYWREPDGAYLVMRYLRGGNLRQILEAKHLSPEDTAGYLDQLALALAYAHQQGVIHRDVKPENILLDDQANIYLSDFGIAKDLLEEHGQTSTGAVIGSFSYIPPEQALSQPVTASSDIYSLGVVAFEMLTGEHPFTGETPTGQMIKHVNEPLPSLHDQRPDLPPHLDEVIRRATNKDPDERYSSVIDMAADFRTAVTSEEILLSGLVELELANPYKGLRPFEEADASDFFGREELVKQIIQRLAADDPYNRFLALVGPSGSGKSSIAYAGLLPAIRSGALTGSESWFVLDMLPGKRPLDELEIGLLQIALKQPANLREQLLRDEFGLYRATQLLLPNDDSELLIVIDQFEELFTSAVSDREREHFLSLLVNAASEPRSRVRILITLRADFYDRPLLEKGFSQLIKARTEVIVPMTSEELGLAITQPVANSGIQVQPELLAQLTADVSDEPGALPMLQYALTELFERREGRTLALETYHSIGGVTGAIAQRAEEIFGKLDPPAQDGARQLFLRLVTLGEGVEDTRRRVRRSELEALESPASVASKDERPAAEQNTSGPDHSLISSLLSAFGSARLLTFDHDPATREPTVEVAHEALLREWERLRMWLDEGRSDVRLQRLLAAAAAEWQESGQDPGFLLRGSRINQFENWAAETDLVLTSDETSYLEASLVERRAREIAEAERLAKEEALERRSRNRLRALVGVFAVAALIAIVLTIFAFNQQQAAEDNEALAIQGQATATVAQGEALFQAATAEAERIRAEDEAFARSTAQAQAESQRLAAESQQRLAEEQKAAADEQRIVADEQRAIAEEQTNLSRSRELAVQSEIQSERDPDLSLLLAMEAMNSAKTSQAYSALHQAVLNHRLVRTMSVPDESVNLTGIALSPDNQTIATTGFDGIIRMWDADSGELLRSWPGHESFAFHVSWSSEGRKLATSGYDAKAKVWDPYTGQELFSTDSNVDDPYDNWPVAFNPDGSQLLSPTADGRATVWDTETGDELLTVNDSGGVISGATFSPDGSLIATVGTSSNVKIWDAADGDLLLSLPNNVDWPWIFEFSPSGTYLAALYDIDSARVWNIPELLETYPDSGETPLEGAELFSLSEHDGTAVGAAFSPDEKYLYTGGQDGTIKMWDLERGEERLSLTSKGGAVNGIEVSQECSGPPEITVEWCGRYVISSHSDGTLRFWDVSPMGNQELATFPEGIAKFNADGTELAIFECCDSDETGEWLTRADVWSVPSVPEDGHYPPEASSFRLISSYEIPKYAVGAVGDNPLDWNDARTRFGIVYSDNELVIYDFANGEVVSNFSLDSHTSNVEKLAISPDDQLVASGDTEGVTKVWDADSGDELLTIYAHTDFVDSLDFSPDSKLLITTSWNGEAKIWDATTGEMQSELVGHTDFVRSSAFSPNGRTVATGSRDTSVRLWDVATGKELFYMVGHRASVNELDFNADGSLLATSSAAGDVVNLWDTATGELVYPLGGPHGWPIWLQEFSPDGSQLLIGTWNGWAAFGQLLMIKDDPLLEAAVSKLTRWFSEDECQQFLQLEECPPPPVGFSEH